MNLSLNNSYNNPYDKINKIMIKLSLMFYEAMIYDNL
jgi:hypothetical protein